MIIKVKEGILCVRALLTVLNCLCFEWLQNFESLILAFIFTVLLKSSLAFWREPYRNPGLGGNPSSVSQSRCMARVSKVALGPRARACFGAFSV